MLLRLEEQVRAQQQQRAEQQALSLPPLPPPQFVDSETLEAFPVPIISFRMQAATGDWGWRPQYSQQQPQPKEQSQQSRDEQQNQPTPGDEEWPPPSLCPSAASARPPPLPLFVTGPFSASSLLALRHGEGCGLVGPHPNVKWAMLLVRHRKVTLHRSAMMVSS